MCIRDSCYAQLNPDNLKNMEGVDMVIGTRDKFKVLEFVEKLDNGNFSAIHTCSIESVEMFNASYTTSERTRGFLKVQDGCDYHCSYCTVPLARGQSRNAGIQKTVAQAQEIAGQGIAEIVLTGVNIGDFGRSTGESFFDLLKELLTVKDIQRYRISSIEPNLLTDQIIRLVAEHDKMAKHFHIPLQSGCNTILAQMKRRYNRELYADKVSLIRSIIPLASVGSDVIVGFPGEGETEFEDTYRFIESQDISYLHVFPYSERPNTPAATMKEKVSHAQKEERSKRLISLSKQKSDLFYQKNIHRNETVIFESRIKNNRMMGFTSNYVIAEAPVSTDLFGKPVRIELLERNERGNMEVKIV